MNRIILIIVTLVLFLPACSENTKDKERFIQTYKEILIARELYPDTALANPEVRKIYVRNGYTETSFRKAFFSFAENKKEFVAMLDSARARAEADLIRLEKLDKEKGVQPPMPDSSQIKQYKKE